MKSLKQRFKQYLDGPMVRPLALAAPVIVLLLTLPLLRPLRHPDPGAMSTDEVLRLASIRALVDHGSLSLDRGYAVTGVVRTRTGTYSSQPPMMAVLLSGPAWLMSQWGLTLEDNPILVAYLLTVLGVTLPVAGAAGLIYRMGRLFELRRPLRTAMGVAVVAASGLLSYAVVLNPHAPAAALVLASAACLVHVTGVNRAERRAGWFALAGACAALAATLDPAAAVLLLLLMFVIPAMRLSIGRRAMGVVLYILGATPVISLHAAWNIPITGDLIPASVHVALSNQPSVTPVSTSNEPYFEDDASDADEPFSARAAMARTLGWFYTATLGSHGLLSHFPVLIFGCLGIGAVMHRHWPSSTKAMAGATGVGAVAVILLYHQSRIDWSGAMFASRWFVVFSPLLLFWAGAWIRRKHRPLTWAVAGLLLAFSLGVGFIGAADPTPRHGFDHYTAADGLSRLLGSRPGAASAAVADREL